MHRSATRSWASSFGAIVSPIWWSARNANTCLAENPRCSKATQIDGPISSARSVAFTPAEKRILEDVPKPRQRGTHVRLAFPEGACGPTDVFLAVNRVENHEQIQVEPGNINGAHIRYII